MIRFKFRIAGNISPFSIQVSSSLRFRSTISIWFINFRKEDY